MSKTPITREELDKACNIVFADNTDFCAMKVDAVEAVRRLMMLQNAFAVFMSEYVRHDTISDDESFAMYTLSQTIGNLYNRILETKDLTAPEVKKGSSSNVEAQSE